MSDDSLKTVQFFVQAFGIDYLLHTCYLCRISKLRRPVIRRRIGVVGHAPIADISMIY